MTDRVRPYLYYDIAVSICSACYRKVEGKIVFEDGNVFLLKRCPEHGAERVLVADDVDYYRRSREVFIKPAIIFYWRDGRRGVVKGLIIAAAITFMLNATCTVIFFTALNFQ